MRMVHTWRLRGRGAVVLGRAVPRRAAVRRALPVRTVSAGRIELKPERYRYCATARRLRALLGIKI